jgi:hypothetical protein
MYVYRLIRDGGSTKPHFVAGKLQTGYAVPRIGEGVLWNGAVYRVVEVMHTPMDAGQTDVPAPIVMVV